MSNFYAGIIFFLAGGFCSLFVQEKHKGITAAVFSILGTILILSVSFPVLILGKTYVSFYSASYPFGLVKFVIDPLSAFFLTVISIMSLMGMIYSIGYLKPYEGKNRTLTSHYLFLSLLIVSQLMVVVAQNALVFLIAWEIMSLSSFFLVVFENEKKEVFDAGLNYLIVMHIGVIFLMTGFAICANASDSFDFASFKIGSDLLFVLFFIGFAMKAGFVPLHTWLPRAHPAAPGNVSGMMSGIMIKTGIYGIFRILSLMGAPSHALAYFVFILSAITALTGVLYAIAQHDLKKLLAYHSVENIGIIGMGIGVGMIGLSYAHPAMAYLGFGGALLHVLNHSIFKELLFFAAGAVHQKIHSKNIEEMGGLGRRMPWTSLMFLVGSIAICGLPPLNGFISEFSIYMGMLEGIGIPYYLTTILSVGGMAALALVGAMAVLCFTKAYGVVFLGAPRTEKPAHASEASLFMLLPMGFLALMTIFIGLAPRLVFRILENPISQYVKMDGMEAPIDNFLGNILGFISSGGILLFAVFLAIWCMRYFLLGRRVVRTGKTWDCGYQAGNPRMQYTASSYAKPFLILFRPILHTRQMLEKPEGVFPARGSYESHAGDIIEKYVMKPCAAAVHFILDLFAWIQSGSTQQYILYGMLFLLGLLIYAIMGIK